MLYLDAELPPGALVDQAGPALAAIMAGVSGLWFQADPDHMETQNGVATAWQARQGTGTAQPAQPNKGHGKLGLEGLELLAGKNCGFALEGAAPDATCLSFAVFYTAPTAIRSLMSFGTDPIKGKDLSSLKVLGTVGEPINEEAWHWYDDNIGKNKCPIIDTWWQTETGACLISNLAGVTSSKPSWATLPMPGVQPILVDENGKEITEKDENGIMKGNLCIKAPWPGILRTTYGDHERCRTNYFATYPGLYFTGDGALKDEEGNYRITGRVDDVLNISGHRIGTAEVENAINMHAGVVESAVVGYPHDIKGQGIYAYVIYNGHHGDENLRRQDILQTVTRVIGAIAKPDKIQFVTGLPKTRSGKIMRRILRKIAEGEMKNLGDISTLLDPGVVEEIKEGKL